MTGLSSLTKPETVKALALLSPDEEAHFALLEKSLLDLQANDPEKLARQLTLRAGRVRTLARHLKDVETVLSADAVSAAFEARKEERRKAKEAQRLRAATFPEGLLKGTGTERWSRLWESARQFSEELVYPDQSFPVVENGARCVLCQQDLDHEASQRLRQFEAFVASTTERELREAREKSARLRTHMHRNGLGDDGALWHAWQIDQAPFWSAWESLGAPPPKIREADRLTVGTHQDGRLEVFLAGEDGAVWHTSQIR